MTSLINITLIDNYNIQLSKFNKYLLNINTSIDNLKYDLKNKILSDNDINIINNKIIVLKYKYVEYEIDIIILNISNIDILNDKYDINALKKEQLNKELELAYLYQQNTDIIKTHLANNTNSSDNEYEFINISKEEGK